MPIYDVLDWYWLITGQTVSVWSSSRMSYVSRYNDDVYKSWLGAGYTTTTIASASDLVDVMMSQWIPRASAAGAHVTCASDDSLSGVYAIDERAIGNLTALATGIAAGKPLPSGGSSFTYRSADGTPRTFTADQFKSFAYAIETYVYQTQDAIASRVLDPNSTVPLPSQPISFS